MNRDYAGFKKRSIAFFFDYLLILLYLLFTVLVNFLLRSLFPGLAQTIFSDRILSQLAGFLFLTLPVTLYFALSEASSRQATWGKRKRGLKVTGPQGERISMPRSLLRSALKFIPWELAHTLIWQTTFYPESPALLINTGFILVYALLGANLLSMLLRKNHQTIYDCLAGTYVLREPI